MSTGYEQFGALNKNVMKIGKAAMILDVLVNK